MADCGKNYDARKNLRNVPQVGGYSQRYSSQNQQFRQAASNAHAYSRYSGLYSIPKTRRRSKLRSVLMAIAALVLVIALAFGGGLVWYGYQLDKNLGSKQNSQALGAPTVNLTKPFYVLLMGSDSREGSGTSSNPAMSGDQERSDVIMLARVDASSRTVTLVSVPRDTPYSLNGGKMKINETYNMGGPARTVKAVEQVTGVEISHFIDIHISGLENVVDALGGVEVTVPVDMGYRDALTGEWINLKAGKQTLDGQQAQIFARCRHEYDGNQDAGRQDSNRQLVEAIMKTLLGKPALEIPGLVLELATYVDTDLNSADFVALAGAYGVGQGKMKVYSCTGPTDGDIDEDTGLWLCYDDPQAWRTLMAKVDSGKNPND